MQSDFRQACKDGIAMVRACMKQGHCMLKQGHCIAKQKMTPYRPNMTKLVEAGREGSNVFGNYRPTSLRITTVKDVIQIIPMTPLVLISASFTMTEKSKDPSICDYSRKLFSSSVVYSLSKSTNNSRPSRTLSYYRPWFC